MASVALEGITVLSDDVDRLARFFENGLDLTVAVREEHYVAFAGDGVRLAIFRRSHMGANTHNHPSFSGPRGNQAFELNFECADAAGVDRAFGRVVEHGATAIASPVTTEWGHYTAFFADPEGNIHSLFAVVSLPS